MTKEPSRAIGALSLYNLDNDKIKTGTAYFEQENRIIFAKIVSDGYEPYTIPKHRLVLELNAGNYLFTDKIYNEIPVFAEKIFTTKYPLDTYLTVDTEAEAINIIKNGFNALSINIQTKNKYHATLEDEEYKVKIEQQAGVKEIFAKENNFIKIKATTAYSLKDGYILTPGITLSLSLNNKIDIKNMESLVKAFYIYYYLYHPGQNLIINNAYVNEGTAALKYNVDTQKYKIQVATQELPTEDFAENINIEALSKVILFLTSNRKDHRRIKNAFDEFFDIASGKQRLLSNGCILECSILEKLIGKKGIEKSRKAILYNDIDKILVKIKKMKIDREIKDFYIDKPEKILGHINNKPFLRRVLDFCNDEKIPITKEDIEALTLVYKYRNQLIHGQTELDEKDIDEKIQSQNLIEEKIEDNQKAFYYKYRTGAFHGVYTLLKQIIIKWLDIQHLPES